MPRSTFNSQYPSEAHYEHDFSGFNTNAHLSDAEYADKIAKQYLDSFDRDKLVDWKDVEQQWDEKWGKL
jgi:hypothetical protein